MAAHLAIRDATPADAATCARIYDIYVRGTAISFEETSPTTEEMAERIAAAQEKHAWLVREQGGEVVGYAYGVPFKTRPAYRWAAEVSVYLDPSAQRNGHGRALYEALLARLVERGIRTACAGITLPNDASIGLHESLGFERVGSYPRIGWKNGGWHDVARFQRSLGEDQDPPAEPS